MEKYELEKALGGEENMANFQYSAEEKPKEAGVSQLIEITLRDTCVKAYRRADDKVAAEWLEGGAKQKAWEELRPQINAIIKIALILTDHNDT